MMACMNVDAFRRLILEMRQAFHKGKNAMEIARSQSEEADTQHNTTSATLIAYDLQAGSYAQIAVNNPEAILQWCSQLANAIRPHIKPNSSILEIGCGEATTLAGVIKRLSPLIDCAYGFDLSWSRIHVAHKWISSEQINANLFVGDLFSIPLADNSIDIIYSSHSLEPNGGREQAALRECLRVAKDKVILIEPIYELAQPEAQRRMEHHGYVRNLKETAKNLGAKVVQYELLPFYSNPLNPSGVIVLEKKAGVHSNVDVREKFQCPLTGTPLNRFDDVYYADEVGLAYPVLRSIPLLRAEHAVVASLLNGTSLPV